MAPSSSQRIRVGFIGLGIMGKPMAGNVLKAGFPLIVYSRSPGPVEDLVKAGASAARDPAEVGSQSDVVIIMIPGTADVDVLLSGPRGLLTEARRGLTIVDMGTHDPSAVAAWVEQCIRAGADFLDAPVSGGQVGAIEGTLSIMVGGTASALSRASDVLAAMGSRIVHIGDSGAGMVAKACNQLVVGSAIQAVAEALALARAAGVDPAKVRDALLGGFAASRVLEVHGLRMLERNFTPGARVSIHDKDARIVMETARRLDVGLPGFSPVAEAFAQLMTRGDADLDHSALITLVDEGWR